MINSRLFLYGLFLTAPWEGVLYVTLAGLNLRPYQFFLLMLSVVLFARKRYELDAVNVLLFLYVISGVPSLLNSRSAVDSVITLMFQFIMVVIAISVRSFLNSPIKLRQAVIVWVLVIGNIVNLFGLLQFMTWVVGIPISEQFAPNLYPLYRPYSFFIEPNFYGGFLASQLAILVVLWFSPIYKSRHLPVGLSSVLALFLLALNQSRGPWLAFMLAIALFISFKYLIRFKLPVRLIPFSYVMFSFAVGVLLTMMIFSPKTASAFAERIKDTLNPLNEGAASERVYDMKVSIVLSRHEPVIGHGVGTWGLYIGRDGRGIRTPPRNIFLAWLFEKGLLGLSAGLALFVGLIGRVVFALKTEDVSLKTLTWATFVGWLAVFVTFQFTTLEISPFYWIVIGLLLASTDSGLQSQFLPNPPSYNVQFDSKSGLVLGG